MSLKLDEPLSWRQFGRGVAVSMAVGFAAAFCVLLPVTVAWNLYERVTGA